jgi:EpsI family protein
MPFHRLIVVGLVLIGGILATHDTKPPAAAQERRELRYFPATFAMWHSEDLPFEAEIVKEIGADDYINREYFGGGRPVELFIGYYKDEQSGEVIHSPKNCLPGSGWEPVRSSYLQIGSADNPVFVNEYIVEKGSSRDLVLYWYQSHERIVASEYQAKFWLVADGVRRRRTDGAMIRIWTTTRDGEKNAQERAKAFARLIYLQVAELVLN